MNLASILALVLQNPQAVESTVTGLINMFKATTAPAHVDVPATPANGNQPALPATTKKPSEAVRQLQGIINAVLKPAIPLKEDGWLGTKTEAEALKLLAMAKPYLAMLGK